jgi:hypothetical protein
MDQFHGHDMDSFPDAVDLTELFARFSGTFSASTLPIGHLQHPHGEAIQVPMFIMMEK